MKIQGLLAGLGVAGKVALGASLAAAATTGAGAAGILPGPVQHIVATTVGAVTPFHMPGDGTTSGGPALEDALSEPTSTTQPQGTTTTEHATSTTTHAPTTTVPGGHDGGGAGGGAVAPPSGGTGDSGGGGNTGAGAGGGDTGGGDSGGGLGGVVTPTTEHHGDGGSSSGTETTTTPTTTPRGDTGGGDSNNPQSLSISCERAQNPNRIYCHWTASTSADHDKYVLLRITSSNDPGRVLLQSPDALAFGDTTVTGGVGYGYRVISLRSDGTVEAHSNIWTIMCCGDAGSGDSGTTTTTTSTTQPHDGTTTTTTSTTQPHDGTTTTSTPH